MKDKDINARILAYRRIKKVSQQDVADYLGIKVSTYSQMEREGIITCEKLIKIAEFLNVDIRCFLYGFEYEMPKIEIKEEVQKTDKKKSLKNEFENNEFTKKEYNYLVAIKNLEKRKSDFIMKLAIGLVQKKSAAITIFEENNEKI